MRSIGRFTRTRLMTMLAALAFAAPAAWSAEGEVIIRATALEPHVLETVAGRRVNFVKRVDRPVHVEFGDDIRQHQVVQMPVTGPIWAVFHRPGTHPYVVHIYGAATTAISGLVEVVEDPERPFGPGTCGAIVLGECLEP